MDPKDEKTTTEQPETDATAADAGQGEPTPATITHTQDQLEAILKDRLARSMSTFTSKAKADVLAELGIEDVATAKKTLAEAETAKKAQMTELEKAQSEIAEAQAKAAQATTEAEAIKVKAAEALLQAAVISKAGSFQDPMDAWSFIDRAKIEVQDDGTYKGIDEALKTLIEAKPYLVKTDSGTPGPGTPARAKPKSIVEKMIENQSGPAKTAEELRPDISF
ncbi:hypothetical protein LCGC14_1917820 [marine sediment metagenome]|uniref:Scaffolding protein n=1 Tax=marine sediment metagenome TaxID=412755 RepID=A0A0F9FSF1_9ZZZZ